MPATTLLNQNLMDVLACPRDQSDLHLRDDVLICGNGHQFPVENGVPIFADEVRRELVPRNMAPCGNSPSNDLIDSFVSDWLVNTNGNLYWQARGNLRRYPIPRWPLPFGADQIVVDVGCSWGRWSIAAGQAGFLPIGMDVHIDALAAARRVSQQLGVQADFVCGDAECLPFQSGSVDVVFSYSVLQHLDKAKVRGFFKEAARVLKRSGTCFVQLPNAAGLYNILLQAKRGFREARSATFEMRYWSRTEIRDAVAQAGLQDLRIIADGFFTQNPQLSDLDLLSPVGKIVVLASYAGRKATSVLPVLTRFADSLWVEARSSPAPTEAKREAGA